MKSFLEFYSQIKEDAMDAANPAMQAPQAPTMQNVRPAPAMAKRLQPQPPAGQQQQAGQAPAAEKDETITDNNEKILKELLGSNYQSFVTELGQNIKAPQFLKFLRAGLKDGKNANDDKVNFAKISPKCSDLSPTQNEIDIDKSLSFPLRQTSTTELTGYFSGGTFAPGGPIITCGGGKFIIDGHHRWSQLYCMNPNAQIEAIDLTDFSDPEMALKVTQIAIATRLGEIPVQLVNGTNLIGISEDKLKDYIKKTIGQEAINAFSILQKRDQNKQEGNFEFILNYLKRLDEYIDKYGKEQSDYSGTGEISQKDDEGKPIDGKLHADEKSANKASKFQTGIKAKGARNPSAVSQDYFRGDQEYNVIEFAHNYIWKNVQAMNASNAPVAPASARGYMPQTDDANGWDSALKSGEVNWKQECLVLSGLIIRD